jgi:uncharacterized membrane protein
MGQQHNHKQIDVASTGKTHLAHIQQSLLPPAEQMTQYENIYPSATEKIFDYIANEQKHRFEMDVKSN